MREFELTEREGVLGAVFLGFVDLEVERRQSGLGGSGALRWNGENGYLGPSALLQQYRWVADSRDNATDESLLG